MTELEFATSYLRAVEKKHADYFKSKKIGIMDCVILKGTTLIKKHVIPGMLPVEITYDIEEMFWRC